MGELLYCYTRGLTSCCFVDEECGGTWQVINDDMTQKAVDFMRAPLMVVDNIKTSAGYDTCHRTREYDVEKCHRDCLKAEKSQFAKDCRAGGGLYKCCIRLVRGGWRMYKCCIRLVRGGSRTV